MNKKSALLCFCLLTVLAFLYVKGAGAEEFCPGARPPLAAGVDDLRMPESEFNYENFTLYMEYLSKKFPDRLWSVENTKEFLSSTEYYLAYPNVVTAVHGFALKQRFLRARAELALQAEKAKNGSTTQAEVAKAKVIADNAKAEYCKFVATAEYVD
jgi:hypothetical protein